MASGSRMAGDGAHGLTGYERRIVRKPRILCQPKVLEKGGFSVAEIRCRLIPMIYGYARVSTDGQSVDAQVRQLRAAGAGDVLMVTRLDRLARSTHDLLNTLALIADREAGFRSLGDAWADTTTTHARLMLIVLGGLAEFERELIRTRTTEGRRRAVARGVRMGRKPKLTPHQAKEAIKRRDRGEPMREIARSYNVSHSTISRLVA